MQGWQKNRQQAGNSVTRKKKANRRKSKAKATQQRTEEIAILPEELYGFMGWQEFSVSRARILAEYDNAKSLNTNRPVRTSHGNSGEAAFRNWLLEFLPAKYGVTSGYIIKEEVVSKYKLYHYDVIIYDKLESPILWIESNSDESIAGRSLAIPSRYVLGVIECKATFNTENTKNARDKLLELNDLRNKLPDAFFCAALFFELPFKYNTSYTSLKQLVLFENVIGYSGALILRSDFCEDLSGKFYRKPNAVQNLKQMRLVEENRFPISGHVDELHCVRYEYGGKSGIEMQRGMAIDQYYWADQTLSGDLAWNVLKIYRTCVEFEKTWAYLDWSHDMFASFATDLLVFLGINRPINDRESMLPVGRVFHRLELTTSKDTKPGCGRREINLHSDAKQKFHKNTRATIRLRFSVKGKATLVDVPTRLYQNALSINGKIGVELQVEVGREFKEMPTNYVLQDFIFDQLIAALVGSQC